MQNLNRQCLELWRARPAIPLYIFGNTVGVKSGVQRRGNGIEELYILVTVNNGTCYCVLYGP